MGITTTWSAAITQSALKAESKARPNIAAFFDKCFFIQATSQ
jgi:hypothetical protein